MYVHAHIFTQTHVRGMIGRDERLCKGVEDVVVGTALMFVHVIA
jgi:hypothetical protein